MNCTLYAYRSVPWMSGMRMRLLMRSRTGLNLAQLPSEGETTRPSSPAIETTAVSPPSIYAGGPCPISDCPLANSRSRSWLTQADPVLSSASRPHVFIFAQRLFASAHSRVPEDAAAVLTLCGSGFVMLPE